MWKRYLQPSRYNAHSRYNMGDSRESGPATGGRRHPYRRPVAKAQRRVQSLSADTVRLYRGITADGRPYQQVGYAWDVVIAVVQDLLLYRRTYRATGQAELQRALNAVALDAPADLQSAVRQLVIEWSTLARTGGQTARRLRHAVAFIEEAEGRPPRWKKDTARRLPHARQPENLRPHATGPRGIAYLAALGLRPPQQREKGRWK